MKAADYIGIGIAVVGVGAAVFFGVRELRKGAADAGATAPGEQLPGQAAVGKPSASTAPAAGGIGGFLTALGGVAIAAAPLATAGQNLFGTKAQA